MNFNNNLPIYVQIMDYIKKELLKGNITIGEKLPSVRAMSSKFKVNPNTVQRAYQELERESITFTKRGKGTFATEDEKVVYKLKKEMSKEITNNFISNMREIGFIKEEILRFLEEEFKKEGS